MRASKENLCISLLTLAGCPRRTTLILFLTSLSKRLSTAILEGAQHNILLPARMACEIVSTRVVVLPVPAVNTSNSVYWIWVNDRRVKLDS